MAFPSKPLTQLLGSNGPVHALTYSSSPSTYILTGSADRTIRLYNPSRPAGAATASSTNSLEPPRATQLIQSYSAHGYEVLDIAVARDNATFASVGGDRNVFLWDVSTAQTIRRFGGSHGHSRRVNSVTLAGVDDALLISGSFDASVRIWDRKASGHKPVMVLEDARDSISCVLVGAGPRAEFEIVSGSVDGRVRYYDLRMGRLDTDVIGAPVTSLARTRDGKALLVGALDSTIRLMNREAGGLLKAYKDGGWKNDEFRVRSSFGGNERWLLSGNEDTSRCTAGDGEVIVWETLTGVAVERIRVPGVPGDGGKKRIGADGKVKERKNVISCVAWKDNGRADQWCCAGTDGVVTVFGPD
ncbi:WD domain-containing protein [Phlyctema vagabunda]|uniref:WD domain-containing protein n=1 Tax=Phlyctema vagabunda TaxID=108571 RepID=A0ABR4PHZ2_9HELO